MSRLFVFGCSFSQYMWPTWATIVAYDLQLPLYNFAFAGLGNVGIMHRVMEADMKFKFTPEDKIMIMWTSWSRDDYVQSHGMWKSSGSRFNDVMTKKDISRLKGRWSSLDDILKNATAISYVSKLYKDNILWQGHGFNPGINEGDISNSLFSNKEEQIKYAELMKFYKDNIPSLPERNLESGKLAFDYVIDSHPDVEEHIDIVQNYIYPCIDYNIRDETVGIFSALHKTIKKTLKKKKFKELHQVLHVPEGIIIEKFPEIYDYLDIRSLMDDMSG